jgi:hypothetical protein
VVIKKKIKLLTVVLVMLCGVTLGSSLQCCWQSKAQTLKFVNPPNAEKDWQQQFVKWPNIPVRVRVEGDAWLLIAADTHRGVEFWNTAIGCTVLETSFQEDAEIVVSFTPQPEDTMFAGTAQYQHRRNKKWGMYWGSDIRIHTLFFRSSALRDNIMAHELGHALGLDDQDARPSDLMYGKVSDGMYVSKEVLETLNRLYCGG